MSHTSDVSRDNAGRHDKRETMYTTAEEYKEDDKKDNLKNLPEPTPVR